MKISKLPLLSEEECFYSPNRMSWITKFGVISREYIDDHSEEEIEKAIKIALARYEKTGRLTHLTDVPLRENVRKDVEKIIMKRFPNKR